MSWIETALYVVAFAGLVIGFRLLLIESKEVTGALEHAVAAGFGVPPPDEESLYFTIHPERWGPGAARWVGNALEISQRGQRHGGWLALTGGAAGFAAALLSAWS